MNIFRLLFFSIISLASSVLALGQLEQSTSLKKYSFEEVDSLMAIHKRHIAIFIHAKWCKYCKNMEHTTFKNKEVINLLNENYYFVSFDAEDAKRIRFHGYTFEFEPSGIDIGMHSLAKELGAINGHITYPTFVILNESYEIVFQHNYFIDYKGMKAILDHKDS